MSTLLSPPPLVMCCGPGCVKITNPAADIRKERKSPGFAETEEAAVVAMVRITIAMPKCPSSKEFAGLLTHERTQPGRQAGRQAKPCQPVRPFACPLVRTLVRPAICSCRSLGLAGWLAGWPPFEQPGRSQSPHWRKRRAKAQEEPTLTLSLSVFFPLPPLFALRGEACVSLEHMSHPSASSGLLVCFKASSEKNIGPTLRSPTFHREYMHRVYRALLAHAEQRT